MVGYNRAEGRRPVTMDFGGLVWQTCLAQKEEVRKNCFSC